MPKDVDEQTQSQQNSKPEEEKKLEDTIEKKEKPKEASPDAKNEDTADLDKMNLQPPQLADYKDNAIVPSNGVALTPDPRVVKLTKQLNTHFRN